MKRFYQIPEFDGYLINRDGICVESIDGMVCDTVNPISSNFDLYVPFLQLGKIQIKRVSDLVVRVFYGIHPSRYSFVDGDHSNVSVSNLKYEITVEHVDNSAAMIDGVEYRYIPNSRNYYISSNGVVYSDFHKKIIRADPAHNGYIRHNIPYIGDPVSKKKYTHLLVYISWKGTIPPGYMIDHIDTHKWNPAIENLEAVTPSENVRRSYAMNPHPETVWTIDTLEDICKLMSEGKTSAEICNILQCDQSDRFRIYSLCHKLRTGIGWKQVSEKYKFPEYDQRNTKFKLHSDDMVKMCRKLYADGLSNSQISKIIGIPRQTAYGYNSSHVRRNI